MGVDIGTVFTAECAEDAEKNQIVLICLVL